MGQQVRIVRTNPGTGEETQETAEVLSTVGGVVLKIGERIEVLREDGIPARVIFDKVPPNLRASPTLSVLTEAKQPVNADVTLAYLTHGLSWNADYVAVFAEAQGNVSIQGWITLTNNSGTTFENASAQLVAGDINVVGSEAEWFQLYNMRRFNPGNRRAAGVESSAREQLADYYVYPIAQPTTIANNQTKQVSFLSAERVKADRGYEQTFYDFQSQDEPVSAEVRVRFSNSQASGLGDAAAERRGARLRARRARPAAVRRRGSHRPHERGIRSRAEDRRRVRRDHSADADGRRRALRAARRTTTWPTSCATRARRRSP